MLLTVNVRNCQQFENRITRRDKKRKSIPQSGFRKMIMCKLSMDGSKAAIMFIININDYVSFTEPGLAV